MGGITDLEMTKLCAEAMKISVSVAPDGWGCVGLLCSQNDGARQVSYDPLHDDAQAMALQKRFNVGTLPPYGLRQTWEAMIDAGNSIFSAEGDLNRAIVEVCARMQAAKQDTPSVSEHGEVISK